MLKIVMLSLGIMIITTQVSFAEDIMEEPGDEYTEADVKCDAALFSCTDLTGAKITGDIIFIDKKTDKTYIGKYENGEVTALIKRYGENGDMLAHDTEQRLKDTIIIEKPYPNSKPYLQLEIKLSEERMTHRMFRDNGELQIDIISNKDGETRATCYLSNGKKRALTDDELALFSSNPEKVECK